MRVIAGQYKGRAISAPQTQDIRPTSDRLRETLFNILVHAPDFNIADKRVLDLFAGTGALGIEALSRGASFCLFVDNGVEARSLLRTNTEAFGLNGITKIYKRDAADLGPVGALQAFDLVFCDPPYGKGLAEQALASAAQGGWLKSGACIVVEERAGIGLHLPAQFQKSDGRAVGESALHIYNYEN